MFQNWAVGAPALVLGERCREATCPAVALLSLPRGQGGAALKGPLSEDGASTLAGRPALVMWLAQVLRHFVAALLSGGTARDLSNGARALRGLGVSLRPQKVSSSTSTCVYHSREMLPPGKAGDEHLAAPVRLL